MYSCLLKNYNRAAKGCSEKIKTYCLLKEAGLPVLNSVIVTKEDVENWNADLEKEARDILGSSEGMVRYLYTVPVHMVKNGGGIVKLEKEELMSVMEDNADLWVLEVCKREDNAFCFNLYIDKINGRLHIEVLGKGFDISDLNKGKMAPHECIDLPFPVEYGTYNEWWKRGRFDICSEKEYADSVIVRKKRLTEFNITGCTFDDKFTPLDTSAIEKILDWVKIIADMPVFKNIDMCNISCSILKTGRVVFWDMQTPAGKLKAYSMK